MSILDSIIDQTAPQSPRSTIIRVNNDLSRNTGECHQLAVHASGKVSLTVAGEAAWHTYGTQRSELFDGATGLCDIGRQTVDKVPAGYMVDGVFIPVAGQSFLIRDTDQRYVSDRTVGDGYTVFQDDDCVELLETIGGEFGAKFETMGRLTSGKFFAGMLLPDDFEICGSSIVDRLLVTNHHATESLWCHPTSTRTVCRNTVSRAARDRKRGFALRHTLNMRDKLARLRELVREALLSSASYRAAAEKMAQQACPAPVSFFDQVLDHPDLLGTVVQVTSAESKIGVDGILNTMLELSEIEREKKAKSLALSIRRRQNLVDDMIARYNSERCAGGESGETIWSAYNAITEYANHGLRYNGSDPAKLAESRIDSILDGRADVINQTAYDVAMSQVS